MTARKMRQDYFTFKPQFQLVIASNNKPQFNLVDDSIRRRLVLVPFDQKFLGSKTDKNLKVKLLNEAPAILNWMIEGCLEWQRDGLGIPKKVRLATDEYLQNEDLIQLWLNDNCALSDEVRTTSTALYDNFKTFVSKENRTPLQKSVFYDELEKKGFPKERDSKERFIKKIYLK